LRTGVAAAICILEELEDEKENQEEG